MYDIGCTWYIGDPTPSLLFLGDILFKKNEDVFFSLRKMFENKFFTEKMFLK